MLCNKLLSLEHPIFRSLQAVKKEAPFSCFASKRDFFRSVKKD